MQYTNDNDIYHLLHKISKGDSASFEKMYKRYFKKCYSIALYYVQSTSHAEDVVSDVFLSLWSKRKQLSAIDNWDSYLFITVKNHALSFLNRNIQDNLTPLDQFEVEIAEDELSPEEKLLKEEMENTISQAILQLPEKTKLVYFMVREEHMSYKQVSEALGISERTVNTHMTTAIRKIVSKLHTYLKK